MEIRKMHTVKNNGKETTLIVGNYVRVKTKDENVIGKIVDLGSNYMELELSKHNVNKYKSFLYVNLLEIEEYED